MTTYTNTFGGDTVYPSSISYLAYALTANTTFVWPIESNTNLPAIARIMDVTPSGAGLSIIMPDATQVGVGMSTLFVNKGSDTFTIKNASGTSLFTCVQGSAWYLYLTNNTTTNGTWNAFQYGASSSVANAAGLAGYGLVAIGATLNQTMPVSTLNGDYTVGDSDRSKAFVWQGGAGTLTLPLTSTIDANWFIHFRNDGTGALTIDCQGGDLINDSGSLSTDYADSSIIVCDGTNFYTIGLSGGAAASSFSYISIDLTGLSGEYTLSGGQLGYTAYLFSGALGGAINIVVPATVQPYWIDNQATGNTLDVGVDSQAVPVAVTSGERAILYCDGTNVLDADTSSMATPVAIADGGTGAANAANARTNLGGTATGVALFTAASAAAARTAIGSPSNNEAIAYALAL